MSPWRQFCRRNRIHVDGDKRYKWIQVDTTCIRATCIRCKRGIRLFIAATVSAHVAQERAWPHGTRATPTLAEIMHISLPTVVPLWQLSQALDQQRACFAFNGVVALVLDITHSCRCASVRYGHPRYGWRHTNIADVWNPASNFPMAALIHESLTPSFSDVWCSIRWSLERRQSCCRSWSCSGVPRKWTLIRRRTAAW